MYGDTLEPRWSALVTHASIPCGWRRLMLKLFQLGCIACLVFDSVVLAQSSPSALLAGWGYTAPTAVLGAPGQIIVVSLYGLATRTVEPFHVYDASGKYTTLNSGISVLLVQSNEPTQVPVP